MDPEDFELAVTAIILLRRIRKRRFERKARKQWVHAVFKESEEEDAKRENFYHTNWYFLQLLLKFHLLLNYIHLFSQCSRIFSINECYFKNFQYFNKSNYLLKQHYFNHFHFTQKWFFE